MNKPLFDDHCCMLFPHGQMLAYAEDQEGFLSMTLDFMFETEPMSAYVC